VLADRYRLLYKLGHGGMGSVWLAEDRLLERSVALKELIQHAGNTDLSERRMRAVQEARAMARVRNPAIVPIHDVFFVEGDPWIVMEYISGHSLLELIKDQSLDEVSIARIGLHVLRGLIAVHRAGVVHRDVKPTNILVADDDSIFLVDFGIARIAGDISLTGQAIVGTPEYLAPERFKPGYKVGPPADIWALGVTFYYAVEGYSPFWRNSERGWEATMMAILNEAPRPPSRRGRLTDITLRMLHKDPNRRADAHQVLAVLERVVGGMPAVPSARPPRLQMPAEDPARQRVLPDSAEGPGMTSPFRALDPDRVVRPRRRERDGGASAPPSRRSAGAPERQVSEARDRSAGAAGRGPRFDDARGLIRNVGTDTGVAMLLAMSEEDAARILADCTPRQCGGLLQGIAAARPATAAAILRRLRSTAAARAFAYLRPETAASVVALMTPAGALRILDSTDERTVAGVIMELAVPTSTALLMSMYSRQRAAQVLTHVRPVTAAELLRSDAGFASAVLRHLSEPVRKQISRHLVPRERPD
jgi:serine/threonine protein kinase/flagellar motility protein MotE (MotC chaperone)